MSNGQGNIVVNDQVNDFYFMGYLLNQSKDFFMLKRCFLFILRNDSNLNIIPNSKLFHKAGTSISK